MWGGVTSAKELRAIADVAEKYAVPTVKVTGGQRIDLLGVKKEDLPSVWRDLNAAGFVSRLLFRDPTAYELWPRLAAIRARTLVVHGVHDAAPVALAEEIAAAIPHAEVVVLEASGRSSGWCRSRSSRRRATSSCRSRSDRSRG
jgi:sulfite reductase beta subunit-like hemoprotein